MENEFYRNLADDISETASSKLTSFLLDNINEDIEARKKWLEPVELIQKYLGFDIKNIIIGSKLSKTYDTTLPTSLIRLYSLIRREFLPPFTPVDTMITNQDDSKATEFSAQRVKDFANKFFTQIDTDFYSDYEKYIFWFIFSGLGVRKVWFDEILQRPNSRFVKPLDFMFNVDCTSINESSRFTQILHLSKADILTNIKNKIYKDIDNNFFTTSNDNDDNSEDTESYTQKTLFKIYESHVLLDLNSFENNSSYLDQNNKNQQFWYIVTFDPNTKQLLSIRRNWNEEDQTYQRKKYFIISSLLPGFNPYGLGLAHLGGSSAIALTTIQRLLLDSGAFKSFTAGFRRFGSKQQDTDINLTPGQYVTLDPSGQDINNEFISLPFGEPSAVLNQLRNELINSQQHLLSTADLGLTERNPNAPVGTTLALLESATQVQSAILRSLYSTFTNELMLMYILFKETIDDSETINRADFKDNIKLIPISDPTTNSVTQRIMRADAVMRTAQQLPDFHNMEEVIKRTYEAYGVQNIDELLKKPEPIQEILPLDPISENQNIIQGIPVTAAEWQDHDAHIIVHGGINEVSNSPEGQAHIKTHIAMRFKIQIQQAMGIELPPIEQLQNPEFQNIIAVKAAEAILESNMNQEQSNQMTVADQLVMADIKQKEEETKARLEIADKKISSDAFKAQMNFDSRLAQIESDEKIAELKAETELEKIAIHEE